MATRRRKKTTTRRKKSTRTGQRRVTARRAYKKTSPRRRRRRAKKNPDMAPLLYAAAGGVAGGLISNFIVPMLPAGMAQQYGGPVLQIALGAFVSTSKATATMKDAGLGMVAVGAAQLVAGLMKQVQTPKAPTVSAGWMPASVVGQRYLDPPASDIPLNSFLADIVVPS